MLYCVVPNEAGCMEQAAREARTLYFIRSAVLIILPLSHINYLLAQLFSPTFSLRCDNICIIITYLYVIQLYIYIYVCVIQQEPVYRCVIHIHEPCSFITRTRQPVYILHCHWAYIWCNK
jgi:hypothetical protein